MTARDSQLTPLPLLGGGCAPAGVGLVAEEEIVRQLKTRSLATWEMLFEGHFDLVYRYALGRLFCREAAEDVAAATFDRALRTINSYSYRGRPILAWLYGIAGNIVKGDRADNWSTGNGCLRAPGACARGAAPATYVSTREF